MDKPYYMNLEEVEYDNTEEHTSDNVFPELDADCNPEKTEWGDRDDEVIMACGCTVAVMTGDTVWMIPGEVPGSLVPVAIDPVTVH